MAKPLSILIIEDNKSDAQLIVRELTKAGYTLKFERAETAAQMRHALEKQSWEIVISDFEMPGFDGFDALNILRESGQDIPFLIMSGTIGEETAVDTMKAGASDYIMKGNIKRLVPCVERELVQAKVRLERKQMEKELHENNELFTLFIKNSPIYTYIKQTNSTESRILYASDNFKQLIGITSSEMKGKTMGELVPAELAAKSTAEDWAVVASGEVVRLEEKLNSRTYDTFKFPIKLEDKTLLAGYSTDITERKQMEEALHASEEKYRTLVEQSIDGIAISDEQGNTALWNKSMESITGLNACDTIGVPLWKVQSQLIPDETKTPELLEQLRTGLEIIYNSKNDWQGESREQTIICADGKRKTVHDSTFAIKTNNTVRLGTILRDITDLKQSEEKLADSLQATIRMISATVEVRDPYTAGHHKRVTDLAVEIADQLGLPKDRIEGIRMAGFIHDLGKIQVPAEILSKPGKLTDLELRLIQTHPEVGYKLVKDIDFPWPLSQIILQHHEKLDGSGYPQGLVGDQIILEARILTVADIVEAMASHRPYRPALGIDQALAEIKKERGSRLDKTVVDACLSVFSKGYKFPSE